jgi:uridine phosphorylase
MANRPSLNTCPKMRELRDEVYFGPKDFRAYLASRLGRPESEVRVPEDVIFTYDRRIFSAATSDKTASPVDWYVYSGRMYTRKAGPNDAGVVHALIGASAAAMNLEELIAYGARRIYEVGVSGAIDTSLRPGDVVVLKGALSDEGTSRHYFDGTKRFGPSARLTRVLRSSLSECRVKHVTGDAWTVDAPYRETRRRVGRYLKAGARVVNMESSAIFAVAAYRNVEVASVQVVSDIVTEQWEPAFHTEIVIRRRLEVLDAVLKAIGGRKDSAG